MCHFPENGSQLEKCVKIGRICHTLKKGSHYELTKVCYPWRNMSHLEKRVTFGKMNHTYKNVPNLEKWFTLGKMGHTSKNRSHLEKWVTRAKVGHSWKNGSSLENGSHLKN